MSTRNEVRGGILIQSVGGASVESANGTLSNLTAPTAINQSLIPNGTFNLGANTSLSTIWSSAFLKGTLRLYSGAGGDQLHITGSSSTGGPGSVNLQPYLFSFNTGATTSFGLVTVDTSGTTQSQSIRLESGNQGGTGNSGAITMRTGTAPGGTRGKIVLQDGTQGTAGHAWVSTDTTGQGGWTGTLSGLTSVTTSSLQVGRNGATGSIAMANTSGSIYGNLLVNTTTPSGVSVGILVRAETGLPLGLVTSNVTGLGSAGVQIETGTTNASSSGSIELRTGTGPTRGDVTLNSRIINLTSTNGISITGTTTVSGTSPVVINTNYEVGFNSAQSVSGTGAIIANSGPLSISTQDAANTAAIYIQSGTANVNAGTSGAVFVRSGSPNSANGGTSGNVTVSSGISGPNGNSGDTIIATGTSANTRGKIKLQDGSQGTVGHVWTQTNADGSGAWQAGGGGGANTSLSNLSATAINVDLLPSANNTRKLGGSSLQYIESWVLRSISTLSGENLFTGQIGGLGLGPAGFGMVTSPNHALALGSANDSTAGATNTGAVNISTGNKTVGTGASGNISLLVGTATGTQGSIKFLKSGVASVVGQVWTATATDGTGYWANAPGASVGSVQLELNTGNGQGSTATRTRRWTNVGTNTLGAHATYADSATDGGTVTINTAGFWSITYNDAGTSGNPNFGITVNANGADSIMLVTAAQRRTVQCGVSANMASSSWVGYLNASDVIRFQQDTASLVNANAIVGARVSFLGP